MAIRSVPWTALSLLPLLSVSLSFAATVVSKNDITLKRALKIFEQPQTTTKQSRRRNLQETDASESFLDFNELLDPNPGIGNFEGDSENSFLGLVSDGLIMLKDYVNSLNDKEKPSINDLLKGLLDDDGSVLFGIEDGFWLELGAASGVNLTSVAVVGLDSFLEADLLRPSRTSEEKDRVIAADIEPTKVLQNSFTLETLVLDLFLTEFDNGSQREIVVRLPFSNVSVSNMPLELGIVQEGLENFPLGAALNHTHRLMPCLRESLFDSASLLALEATFGEVGMPSLISPNDGSTSNFLNLATTLFVGLPASVPIFFNSTVRNLLNDVLYDNLIYNEDDIEIKDPCPSYPETPVDTPLIDFGSFFETGLPAMLVDLLDDQLLAVDPATGLPKINEALILPMMEEMNKDKFVRNSATGETTMVFGEEGGLLNTSTSISIGGLNADVALRVGDLKVWNLDTMIPPLQLLETIPEEAYQLNNTLTMGLDMTENPDRSMGLSTELSFSIATNDGGSISEDLFVQANMQDLSLGLAALLEIVEPKLYGFPVKDVMNLQCWLATLKAPILDNATGIRLESEDYTAGIANLQATLAKMSLDIGCGTAETGQEECQSSGIEELVNIMATQEAQDGLTKSMNDGLNYIGSLLSDGGGILQTPIDRMLNEAAMQCPHSPLYDPEAEFPVTYESSATLPEPDYSYEQLIIWGSIALALVLAYAAAAIGVRCSVRRKHRKMLASSQVSTADKRHIAQQQRDEDALEEALNASTSSMFRSREIPLLVRWGMPVVILGNVALFLSGHLNLGATIAIEANLAGETIKIDDFFDFAIARTTIDLWKAGGRALAILILIFSGIWPYTKQFLTLTLWFLPTSKMSISKRGIYLIWIDRLAKWSMIDIYVIVLCIVAFRVTINSPQVAFLPEDLYSIDLLVIPMWGLYSNMTAQIVSQVSSHFIIYYHRCIVEKAKKSYEQEVGIKKKEDASLTLLWAHHFTDPHFETNKTVVAKKWVSTAILGSSLVVTVFCILGLLFPSFSVELLGIIGVAVESGQEFEEAITNHSVWSIVAMLFEEAQFLSNARSWVGLSILGILVIATAIAVPILQAAGLVYQWFMPLTQKGRRRFSVLNEILRAWQYIEVYLIALFVASW